jgi:hypothetical protein
LESWLVFAEDCMNKGVEETATDPRDSLFKYFAFHILPSNSPAIRTTVTHLSPPYHVLCIKPHAAHTQNNYFV